MNNTLDKNTTEDSDATWWRSLPEEERAELLQRYAPDKLLNDRLEKTTYVHPV